MGSARYTRRALGVRVRVNPKALGLPLGSSLEGPWVAYIGLLTAASEQLASARGSPCYPGKSHGIVGHGRLSSLTELCVLTSTASLGLGWSSMTNLASFRAFLVLLLRSPLARQWGGVGVDENPNVCHSEVGGGSCGAPPQQYPSYLCQRSLLPP